MSLLSKTLWSIGEFFLNLAFIFNLPTEERSYLSELKKRLLKRFSAVSIVGGSPGLKILKISNNASSRDLALSDWRVFLIYEPISILSALRISILFNLLSLMNCKKISSIS